MKVVWQTLAVAATLYLAHGYHQALRKLFSEDYAGQRLPIPVSLEFDSDVFAFPVLRLLYYVKTFCGLSTIQVSSTTGKETMGKLYIWHLA